MLRRSWLGLILPLLVATPALADEGRLVYARQGALVAQDVDGSGAVVELAQLPSGVPPSWIEATRDASLLVVTAGETVAWLPRGEHELRTGACRRFARPAAAGDCMVCGGAESPVVVMLNQAEPRPLPATLREPSFLGPSREVAALTDRGVVALPLRKPAEERLLAQPGARSNLVVSPDGRMAVAVFGEGDASRVYGFLLDGKGVPRRLGGPGVPVAWSWDSTWVLIQEGDDPAVPGDGGGGGEGEPSEGEGEPDSAGEDESSNPWLLGAAKKKAPPKKKPPKKKPAKKKAPEEPPTPVVRTCVVRAVGGESKCWDGYTPLAFSPDSKRVLLKKGTALYVGKIAGVNPEPPKKIADGVDGAATWIP